MPGPGEVASLSELRAKLQEHWREGGGGDEVMIGVGGLRYGGGGGGGGGRGGEKGDDHVDVLTRQLASQMEYNNILLEHLQNLEASHLDTQRELKKKEHALKLSLSASSAARAEAADLHRKWAVASEVAEAMTRKCEEARIHGERKELEAHSHRRQVEDAREECERAIQHRGSMEDRLARAEHDLEAVKSEFSRQKTRDLNRIEELTSVLDTTAKELQDLRKVHVPLSMEHKKVVMANMQLEREVGEANGRLLAESKAREVAEDRAREVDVARERLREAHKEAKKAWKEEQAKVAHCQAELQAAQGSKKRAEEELQVREAWLAEVKLQHKKTVEENKALKSELEQVANELLSQAKLRAHEQERWATKLAKSQEQLATVTEEARIQAQKHALETQKRCSEHMAIRKECEEQYLSLQGEHADLHDLLKEMHREGKERAEGFDAERRGYDDEIRTLKDTIGSLEVTLATREQELVGMLDKLQEELHKTRAEMNTRGSRYVQVLTTLQEHVKSLSSEGAACRDEIGEIANDFTTFKRCVQTFADSQGPPLEAWYAEVHSGMEALVEQNKELQKEAGEKGDQLSEKEVLVEELKGHVITHQTELGSLRHELVDAEERLNKEKKLAEEKLKVAQMETDGTRREKEDAERRLRRLQDTLDFANGQNKKLQEQSQALAKQIAEEQAQHAAAHKRLEESVMRLEQEKRLLDKSRLELLGEREASVRAMQAEQRERAAMTERMKEMELLLEKEEAERKAAEARAERKIHDTKHVLHQSAKQVEHTQRLLDVMRRNKAEAEEQKWALQSEMHDMQAGKLKGAAGGGSNPRGA